MNGRAPADPRLANHPVEPALLEGLPPLARDDARVLVLGSMPGAASLRAGRYYAHPQNSFWPFMGALVGAGPSLDYDARVRRLGDAGVAVWDVLQACEREGSLDSAIRKDSARPNDFARFFAAHPQLRWILFNGARAASDFVRFEEDSWRAGGLQSRRLPSTSPANASQRAEDKLTAWRDAFGEAGIALLPSGR